MTPTQKQYLDNIQKQVKRAKETLHKGPQSKHSYHAVDSLEMIDDFVRQIRNEELRNRAYKC